MKKSFEGFNENLLTGVNRLIKLAQRLLLCKSTGAYCALACPSGYFGKEYGIDTGGPSCFRVNPTLWCGRCRDNEGAKHSKSVGMTKL